MIHPPISAYLVLVKCVVSTICDCTVSHSACSIGGQNFFVLLDTGSSDLVRFDVMYQYSVFAELYRVGRLIRLHGGRLSGGSEIQHDKLEFAKFV